MLSFTSSDINNRKVYRSILNERMDLLNERQIDITVEDARNYHQMSALIGKINPSTIIHLAAVSHANKSNKDPHNTFDHSLRTLENSLDIARGLKTHLIYFSSSMVYGNFDSDTVDEETICNPIGIYGTLKYSGELMVKSYGHVFDLPYTIVRPSALYGERCVSRRVGQIFIERAVQNLDITIQGDGSDKLDFTYIDDLVNGIYLMLDNPNALNQIFNLTFGEGRSIGNLAEILKNHFDNININYESKDNLTPDRGTLSIDKAKNLLNYNPINSIDEGYPKYIDWYKKFWKRVETI